MHRLALLVFVLVWISACIGCGVRPAPEVPHRALAAQLESETVALVRLVDEDGNDDEDGTPHPYCSGVFISPNVIVTAGHCVAFLGLSPAERLLESLGFADADPVGQQARYAMQGDLSDDAKHFWTGKVIAYDVVDDLGAVRLEEPRPSHAYARLSERSLKDGDRVEFVGHPLGQVWSYGEGYISAYRHNTNNPRGNLMSVLQISGPFYPGNSGCGAFDAVGGLIGIGSYYSEDMPGTGFFVHRDAVRAFLHTSGVL